ncbi:MAG: hypothetical protein GXO43_07890 [Crenarchaeota archaeon]|nr:hypothetical protein [Thermoproteota archaeon]
MAVYRLGDKCVLQTTFNGYRVFCDLGGCSVEVSIIIPSWLVSVEVRRARFGKTCFFTDTVVLKEHSRKAFDKLLRNIHELIDASDRREARRILSRISGMNME